MNKIIVIGRIAKDIDLKFTPGAGTAVANFTVAVDRKFKQDGQPTADFIPVVVWGKQAENVANYMSKGRQIGISGRIQTRSYDAKDGTKRYITEIVAEEVQFLGGGNGSQQGNSEPNYNYNDEVTPVEDSNIPF